MNRSVTVGHDFHATSNVDNKSRAKLLCVRIILGLDRFGSHILEVIFDLTRDLCLENRGTKIVGNPRVSGRQISRIIPNIGLDPWSRQSDHRA